LAGHRRALGADTVREVLVNASYCRTNAGTSALKPETLAKHDERASARRLTAPPALAA
jgi:hypothetical protein